MNENDIGKTEMVVPEPVNKNMRLCINCGSMTAEHDVFCDNCGAKQPSSADEPEIPQQEIPHQENTGKKRFLPLIIVSVCLMVFLLGAALSYYLINPASDGDNDINDPGSAVIEEPIIEQPQPETKPKADDPEEQIFIPVEESKPLQLDIVQVDSSDFPTVRFYANIHDEHDDVVRDLTSDSFEVLEMDASGTFITVQIEELRQVLTTDNVSINLVIDKSGSMNSYNRMAQAQNAASYFLNYISSYNNSYVELTFFDSYVYVPYRFTNNFNDLIDSVYGQRPNGSTALYDAIYSALLETNKQRGAKCVIVFTDGEENASSYSFNDVVSLSQSTGIPVYVIGVGNEINERELIELASLCGGEYFYSQNDDLEESLQRIYTDIFNARREQYIIQYTSKIVDELEMRHNFIFRTKEGVGFTGGTEREYVPKPDITSGFSDKYWENDFILEFSSSRAITDNDLRGLSLAELRIARNEIFARHGRMFRDPMLNKWFYSRGWYLSLTPKYSPADFERRRPYPLSRLENDNVSRIQSRENYIMQHERIFPDSATTKLSEYDVSLRRPILQRGLNEIYSYAGVSNGDRSALNDVERYNVDMIEFAMAQPDIQY